jgi:hypothetical protein
MARDRSTRPRLRPLIAAPALIAFGVAAQAQSALPLAKACAAYDLHYVTIIEDHGRAEEISAEEIHSAVTAVLDARAACRAGDFERALRLYGRIPLEAPRVAPTHWIVLR